MTLNPSVLAAAARDGPADLESYAERCIAEKRIPIFCCEGPCLEGRIARRAVDIVTRALPSYGRAWHSEALLAPQSAMTRWIAGAEKAVMIEGCFLKCQAAMLDMLTGADKLVHIVAFPLDRRYAHSFQENVLSPGEIHELAEEAAERIMAALVSRPRAQPAAPELAAQLKCWWPNCNTVLREDVSVMGVGEPSVEHDHTGYYITCPQCGARTYPPQAVCAAMEAEGAG